MRTTLSIDSDVAERIRQEIHAGKRTLKEVINDCLRISFGMTQRDDAAPFRVEPHSSAYHPGFDTAKLNQALDELDAEAGAQRLARPFSKPSMPWEPPAI